MGCTDGRSNPSDFVERFRHQCVFLMEGALGERLKREYELPPQKEVALAAHIYDDKGREALAQLWLGYRKIANQYELPFLATTPTRRANRDRVEQSPFEAAILADNVAFLKQVRANGCGEMYLGALMGCRGDAYTGTGALSQAEGERFHTWAAERFALAGVDFLLAGIMPALPEILGFARAAAGTGLPYIISLMVREDGRLPDGTLIHDAITTVDQALCVPPLCYLSNCVHPLILRRALEVRANRSKAVRARFGGVQANAADLSPAGLDRSPILHQTNPAQWAQELVDLGDRIRLKIAGGCCGTDDAYLTELARRLKPAGREDPTYG